MGFIWRSLAPKPAKTVKRAVTRPAKTARQMATPRVAKRAASRAWRAANPATGVRQEIEGRAVVKTRRSLAGRQPRRPSENQESGPGWDEAVAGMGRAGWVPERVDARSVPFVGDSEAFAVLDTERRAALKVLRIYPNDDQELEELMIVNALYNCQVALINELAGKVNGQRSIDERVLQFWSWTREWMRAAEVDSERRILQQDSVIKRVAPAAAEAIRARTQLRMDAIVRRADT